MKEVLFKVIDDDHEYIIYSNGQVEGFGKNAMVFNYYPNLLYSHLLSANGMLSGSNDAAVPANNVSSSRDGAAHSVPA